MLQISPEKVCYIVVKAHEFDAKVDVVESDYGGNPSDESMREVLEDYADDPVFDELKAFIDGLNWDEQIDLVALAWLGRGDYGLDEWKAARSEAERARGESSSTALYLLGLPLLADYLESGLDAMDISCEDYEIGHL